MTKDGAALPDQLSEHDQSQVRDAYLKELWTSARDEMQAVFENCQGFDRVSSADEFAAYIEKCQVETTMPFHDYWIEPPALKTMPWKLLLVILGLPLLAFAAGLLGWVGGSAINVFTEPNWNLDTPFWMAALGLASSALVIFGLIKYIMRFGANAFPAPKHGDLPSVLKSLYLQQKFAKFVVDNQAADPQTLHTGFGKFLQEHQPENKDSPSQKPGFISSSAHGAVRT
ncbi:MAG: hypothetical protein GY948_16305 [Alphaproteobacteria bacterium]|nr:hypothetical protein [Alphaproteobacteria bacterium]